MNPGAGLTVLHRRKFLCVSRPVSARTHGAGTFGNKLVLISRFSLRKIVENDPGMSLGFPALTLQCSCGPGSVRKLPSLHLNALLLIVCWSHHFSTSLCSAAEGSGVAEKVRSRRASLARLAQGSTLISDRTYGTCTLKYYE